MAHPQRKLTPTNTLRLLYIVNGLCTKRYCAPLISNLRHHHFRSKPELSSLRNKEFGEEALR